MSLQTDIALDGTFGERWLIIDQTHLRVVTPSVDGPARVDFEAPLRDIKETRADSLVGSGALRLVMRDGRVIEAVRYTLALAPALLRPRVCWNPTLKRKSPRIRCWRT